MNKMSVYQFITESVIFSEIPEKRGRGRPAKFEIVHRHLCYKTFNSKPNLKAHLATDHVTQQVINHFKYLYMLTLTQPWWLGGRALV